MMLFSGVEDYAAMGLSPQEIQERMGKWWAWQQKMTADGVVDGGHALMEAAKRVTGPNRTVSDGPFVESKELIGGFYIVKAENADAVVKIAEGYPDYDLGGTVEIREVMIFEK